MRKNNNIFLLVLLVLTPCFADTFVHRITGESFDGYALTKQVAGKTQVRVEKQTSLYIDPDSYRITRNYLGRKNNVVTFSIKNPIELISETEAFEKAIVVVANQGPLFILIEIDSPGGRRDLARRIASAITKIDNCTTIAYIKPDQAGGAYSVAAAIALACDRIYIDPAAQIGAAVIPAIELQVSPPQEPNLPPPPDAEPMEQWQLYMQNLAEFKNRSQLIVRAMLDEKLELVEIEEEGKRYLIDIADKTPKQKVVTTLSEKGYLLTLSAYQALEYGIVDEIIDSRQGLLGDLGAVKAVQSNNTRLVGARRQYERLKTKFDKFISAITTLKTDQAAISEQIDILEARIDRFSEVLYRGGREIQYDRDLYWDVDSDLWNDVIRNRDVLVVDLLDNLRDQIASYRGAIKLAQKSPDLSHNVEALNRQLDNVSLRFEAERAKPRWEMPDFY